MFDRENLLQWRTNVGLSATKLGELVGVEADTIRAWERGENQPREDSAAALHWVMESYSPSDDDACKPAPKKKKTRKKTHASMKRECSGCYYFDNYLGSCDYLLVTGTKRPCPPGKGCTVRLSNTGEKRVIKRRGLNKAEVDPRVAEFYSAGKNDSEISRITGIPVKNIYNWRHRNNLPSNFGRGKKGK